MIKTHKQHKSELVKMQKEFFAMVKKIPKVTNSSTHAQFLKLQNYLETNDRYFNLIFSKLWSNVGSVLRTDPKNAKTTTLSARGWHKDHNNYNKKEKWELPPSLRRTPARNVTKTGAKRKRATTITKYKR
jgi:hypothetical protein